MSQVGTVRFSVTAEQVGVVTIDQPGSRVNVLSSSIVTEFEQVFTQIQQQAGLVGLLLVSGKPGTFIAGADLKELAAADPKLPTSRALLERGLALIAGFETLPYPTLAAIEGPCLGGGLELALGFDYRLASTHPKTQIGLPETRIGLIPGWGGTQRLTRLIGPSLAAQLICAAELVSAQKARELGIVFDAVPSEQLQAEAFRLLAWSAQTEDWRQTRARKQQPVGLTEDQLSFAAAVAQGQVTEHTKGQYPAPQAALHAIFKGCNLPLADGLLCETAEFMPLLGSTIARNLIALFFMNQRLDKDPGIADASLSAKPIQLVGVVGAGIMGSGIAGAHIRRGVAVVLHDESQPALDKGLANITKSLETRVKIGRLAATEVPAILTKLSTTHHLAALADREVVIEAIVEDEPTKVKLLGELQRVVSPETILASNTSTISITRMAQAVTQPERFAGLHFFNPVDRMALVEVIRGEKTSDATVVTLVALAKKIGKTPIVVRDCPGFLVNRILFPYMNEAYVLLEEGATPRALDQAACKFGMPMGPITLSDLVGLDTVLYAGRVVNTAFADRAKTSRIVEVLVHAGRLGQKTGAGFYAYTAGPKAGKPNDDPALVGYLQQCQAQSRPHSEEELTDRLFLPMLVEASRVLAERIVRDPADVDMGLNLGLGFPAFRGGLLRWADTLGMPTVLTKLAKYAGLGLRYEATEMMRELAGRGSGFYGRA